MTAEPPDPLRRRIMAAVRGKDSKAELLVRSHLHRRGFRFRLHARELPGRPDVLLPKWRAAVFVHGCFWHRHAGCPKATTPTTRRPFWLEKFDRNVARDRTVCKALLATGWRIAVVWECALSPRRRASELDRLEAWLREGEEAFETAAAPRPT